jgi:hypothetical protein
VSPSWAGSGLFGVLPYRGENRTEPLSRGSDVTRANLSEPPNLLVDYQVVAMGYEQTFFSEPYKPIGCNRSEKRVFIYIVFKGGFGVADRPTFIVHLRPEIYCQDPVRELRWILKRALRTPSILTTGNYTH